MSVKSLDEPVTPVESLNETAIDKSVESVTDVESLDESAPTTKPLDESVPAVKPIEQPVTPVETYEKFMDIINSEEVSVFDFWATWCGPCKAISPAFERLSLLPENKDVKFYKVDVDEQSKISQKVGIRAMPTFIAFQRGEKIGDFVGANVKGLTEFIEKIAAIRS